MRAEDVTLRPFRKGDGPFVRAIVTEVLTSYGLPMGGETDADLDNIEVAYARGAFFVLEHAGTIVGCGGVSEHEPTRFEVRKMYFLPIIRGLGLGKVLLTTLLDEARRRGATSVYLETNRKLGEAIRLYEKLGFVHMPLASAIPPRCDIVMQLVL